jgi:uncharacterized DUF497 family protein
MMYVEYDHAKDAANIAKHGVSLARASDLEVLAAVKDDRFSEQRYRLYGLLDGVPHCLAATLRNGVVRAISLRRAHSKEFRRHVP